MDQLVILKAAKSMPLKWTLVMIEEIHPGTDGVIRVIMVRIEKGTYKRVIVNIAPLLN